LQEFGAEPRSAGEPQVVPAFVRYLLEPGRGVPASSLKVDNRIDSGVLLDRGGAQNLLGNGGLLLPWRRYGALAIAMAQ
jgi:hypothetical protein